MDTTKETPVSTEAVDTEIRAIGAVYESLKILKPDAQERVLDYVTKMLGLQMATQRLVREPSPAVDLPMTELPPATSTRESDEAVVDDTDGISPIGAKWLRRNAFGVEQIGKIFSIGADEIDLVADKVPGESGRDRMRSVFLLKGAAAYLATGAARFQYQQAVDACTHYDAYDRSNFHAGLKKILSEVTGSRETGFTLTTRGLVSAAALIKEMLSRSSA